MAAAASSGSVAPSVEVEPRALLGLDVLNWRFEELERAGYDPAAAVVLAERGDVDLHVACSLLGQGATVEQALRILT